MIYARSLRWVRLDTIDTQLAAGSDAKLAKERDQLDALSDEEYEARMAKFPLDHWGRDFTGARGLTPSEIGHHARCRGIEVRWTPEGTQRWRWYRIGEPQPLETAETTPILGAFANDYDLVSTLKPETMSRVTGTASERNRHPHPPAMQRLRGT